MHTLGTVSFPIRVDLLDTLKAGGPRLPWPSIERTCPC